MRRFLIAANLVLVFLWPSPRGTWDPEIKTTDLAQSILQEMTPEERVGQLFIVTFPGSRPQIDDPIFDLITESHISGVLLKVENDNYVDPPNTLETTQDLIASLQDAEYQASIEPDIEGQVGRTVYIPLFIGTSHEGGGALLSEIMYGLSELPSEMAIGATWDTDFARRVGEVLGHELASIGFNMLLGPSLDVLEEPRLIGHGDLGVRSFGGDPYWVSVMGQSYIAGLHSGSQNRLAVVAKHFPGLGGADRSIEEEVATVRKSLEQLKQIELAPFFAVTGKPPGEAEDITDALLTSHIRYQGFQGNIRATTRPVSMDPQAYAQLLALEPLAVWRDGGGVTISDSLGSRAMRRFRDPLERSFKGHLVARDAFLAGNDLLLLSDFRSSEDIDEVSTIRSTLTFFANKYREDAVFAQRVDESVLRIIDLKLRLYGGTFTLSRVQPSEITEATIGQSSEETSEIARASVSLISPSPDELDDHLGGPPLLGEKIIFITDVRFQKQCSTCEAIPGMAVNELEDTVLRLYGQSAAGQVGSWNLTSYSMADLAHFLGEPPPTDPISPLTPKDQLEEPLQSAQWIVFSILDSDDGIYGSNALKLLLDRRPDLIRAKRIVVFAFDVPYDLDATEISKIDTMYALYSSGPSFIDVAAHLLFLELSAQGAPPVSVPGIGYDLIEATSPDPEQVISLRVFPAQDEEISEEEPPEFYIGDQLRIETGVIMDLNAHHVPDGTIVEFILSQGDGSQSSVLKVGTQGGIAKISTTLERTGLLIISATSDPARVSETLELNVQEDGPAIATVISPTAIPTEPAEPTSTLVLPTPTQTSESDLETEVPPAVDIGMVDFMLGLISVALMGGVGYISSDHLRVRPSGRIRCTILPIVGGLFGYNYIAWNLPGGHLLLQSFGVFAGPIMVCAIGLIGLMIAQKWCE